MYLLKKLVLGILVGVSTVAMVTENFWFIIFYIFFLTLYDLNLINNKTN